MRAFEFIGRGLSIAAASALLCSCAVPFALRQAQGDNAQGRLAQGDMRPTSNGSLSNNKTFYYTGKEQTFSVPTGVTQLTVVAHGGEGGGSYVYPSGDPPGFPARVYAVIPVNPGDTLYVFVGGSGTHGGFNGGGAGGNAGKYPGNAGGGASDVRAGGDSLTDRILVAAGGGGAGVAVNAYSYGYGGKGGGLAGKAGGKGPSYGDGGGGAGGTQSQGGSGGTGGQDYRFTYLNGAPGVNGALGLGGGGGNAAPYNFTGNGGGGGGGYYGGGGGGGGAAQYSQRYNGDGGGGGGGSSYVESSAIKSRMWTGWKRKGDGLVVFSWK